MSRVFKHRNEPFECQVCGAKNPIATATCRDHCRECLASCHVDINPGDRACACQGIMLPTSAEVKNGAVQRIWYCCQKCKHQTVNRVADDDNNEKLQDLVRVPRDR